MREEGLYARGSVVVRPLPPEVYGTAAERIVPLRRLEGGPVDEEDVARHVTRELEKARTHALGFRDQGWARRACMLLNVILCSSPRQDHMAHRDH